MRKIWVIAWKELVTTFTDRSLLMIMIATPLLLSTIIAFAFGGGGDPNSLSIGEIPIVIVNQDEGLSPADQFEDLLPDDVALAGTLFDLDFGQAAEDEQETVDGAAFNVGSVIVSILAPDLAEQDSGVALAELPACSLAAAGAADGGFDITLEELFAPTLMADVSAARAAVEEGEAVAAVLIPPDFSDSILPIDQLAPGLDGTAAPATSTVAIEVYANAGNPIEANVTRSVVEGVAGQFDRLGLTLLGLSDSISATVAAADIDLTDVDPASVPALDASAEEWQAFLSTLSDRSPWFAALAGLVEQGIAAEAAAAAADGEAADNLPGDEIQAEIGAAVACLFDPDAGLVAVAQQPLNELQTQSFFERVMVQVGSAQAVFFALFTGAFGILGIYQERKQWTLQRMLVSPTSRTSVLSGFLAGNVVVVWAQLALLMIFLSVISSVVVRRPTFIWGDQWLLLFLLTVAISLCVSGLGVLIVGVARTPEQVQVFAPVLNIFLGALGGAFGFFVPAALANLSLITWATDAYRQLAAGQSDIWLNLAVLAAQGAAFFILGLWFFRQRASL